MRPQAITSLDGLFYLQCPEDMAILSVTHSSQQYQQQEETRLPRQPGVLEG